MPRSIVCSDLSFEWSDGTVVLEHLGVDVSGGVLERPSGTLSGGDPLNNLDLVSITHRQPPDV